MSEKKIFYLFILGSWEALFYKASGQLMWKKILKFVEESTVGEGKKYL